MLFRKYFSIVLLSLILLGNNTKGANLFIHENENIETQLYKSVKTTDRRSLNDYYSDKKLGSFIENDKTVFRLFTPSAHEVILVIFNSVEETEGELIEMSRDSDGVWEISVDRNLTGIYYGYKVKHLSEDNLDELPLCVDPYAKAVASYTTYNNPRKSIVYNDEYNWEQDDYIQQDWRDLIIYEMHIRDMTADESAGAKEPGTYAGLIDKNARGGLNYIKELGVNTVELLPAMDFGNCEIPFKDSLNGKFNSWNPYERNHWGYMTSSFFAPSSYYNTNWKNFKWNEWMGSDGSQVKAFKDMVKEFHKNGIAVMMDVVYNHLSEYEVGNLKQIDRDYYFRLDDRSNFISQSGCGNDIKTERPMMRRLIVDSILYWMKEYHIDGFRFDLGKLIDWETVELIIREARKLNPNVVFVCEPWGGGYDPRGFSLREWGSWNDKIRNGIKGENPFDGLGWIFGEWYGNNNITRIKSYVNGTTVKYRYGLFQKKEHSVNYLASHDGYTLGDFIRIGSRQIDPHETIKNVNKHTRLTPLQLKLNKLAAMFLMTSQGMTMIHAGQEYARSKVIPLDIEVADKNKGLIDHNSYEKDNKTNYLDYAHVEINQNLFEYYKGLIDIRKVHKAFRHASPDQIEFYDSTKNKFALGYKIDFKNNQYIVLMNANREKAEEFQLPEGEWKVLADEKNACTPSSASLYGKVKLKPITGKILIKNY